MCLSHVAAVFRLDKRVGLNPDRSGFPLLVIHRGICGDLIG